MYLNKKELLNHFEIACNSRIETLVEEHGKINCSCDIRIENCDECTYWADGVKNYQLYLEDIEETRKKDNVVYHVKSENGFMIKVEDGYGFDEVHDMNDPRVAVFNHDHEAKEHCEFHDEVVIDSNWKYLEQTGTYECADCFRLSRHPDDVAPDCDTCDNTGEVKYV